MADSVFFFCSLVIVNQARALRVTEIINDFRTVQLNISSMSRHHGHDLVSDTQGNAQEAEGHRIMGICLGEAQALLNMPFTEDPEVGKGGKETNPEDQMKLLQR